MARFQEAAETSARALEAITAPLKQFPAAFTGLTAAILQLYLKCSQEAGIEPDDKIIRPVASVLETTGKADAEQPE